MSNESILVIAAHPDDEVLGCGGTIALHVKQRDKVHVAILSEGVRARISKKSSSNVLSDISSLKKSAIAAHKILGAASLDFFKFQDNQMDSICLLEVIKKVEYLVKKYNPSIVYTHYYGDLNIDHRIVNQAVVTACRPFPGSSLKSLLFFEVASSTECQVSSGSITFSPNWFVDISSTLSLKIKALSEYYSEMRQFPHPRSLEGLEHLAMWRGCSVGLMAAEAFVLGRHVNKGVL